MIVGIEGEPNLIRDTSSGAVLVTQNSESRAHALKRERELSNLKRIDMLEKMCANLLDRVKQLETGS